MRARSVLLLLVTAASAACATTPTVKTDFDPQADFSRYHSYVWVYQGAPRGMDPLAYERVRGSIDRQLQARGYAQASPGDFAVAFTIGKRDKVQVTDFGPYGGYYGGFGRRGVYGWGGRYDVYQTTEGSLVVDIYDVESKKSVWHGLATQDIGSSVTQAQIDAGVAAVLAQFPPGPGARPAA